MESYYIYRDGDEQNARLANRTQPGDVPLRTFPWEAQNTQNRPNPITADAKERFEEYVAKVEKLKEDAQLILQPPSPAEPVPVKAASAKK